MNFPRVFATSLDAASDLVPWIILCVFYFVFCTHFIAILYANYFLYKRHAVVGKEEPHSTNGGRVLSSSSSSCSICSSSRDQGLPGVSIIKPLCGTDSKLYENLSSFFQLDYPLYEILFCVATEEDPARDVVIHLMSQYPHVDVKLLDHASKDGINQKVNNMNQGYLVSKYDLILISDSGIWMRPDTLTDMAQVLLESAPRVGMVHQLPYLKPTDQVDRFHDAVQLLYFGCWHARMYLAAAFFNITCTSGMSCLLRKVVLEEDGGLGHFAKYLAEDYFISRYMQEREWRVSLAHQPAWQNLPLLNVQEFEERISRWYKLRLSLSPQTTLLEPFTECFPVTILTSLMWSVLFPVLSWSAVFSIFLLHAGIWFGLDMALLWQLHPRERPLRLNLLIVISAWFYREMHSIPLQLRSMWSRKIKWREHMYRLKRGGIGEIMTTTQQ